MKTTCNIKSLPEDEAIHPFVKKWKVTGKVGMYDLQTGELEIEVYGQAASDIVALCTGHEYGHVEDAEDYADSFPRATIQEYSSRPLWDLEVSAWLRALDGTISLTEGQCALDALYSYKPFAPSPDAVRAAHAEIASRCEDEQALLDYEPMEHKPPEGSTPTYGPEGEPSPEYDPGKYPPEQDGEGDGSGGNEQGQGEGMKGIPGHGHTPENRYDETNDWTKVLTSPEAVQAAMMGIQEWAHYRHANKVPTSVTDPPMIKGVLGR